MKCLTRAITLPAIFSILGLVYLVWILGKEPVLYQKSFEIVVNYDISPAEMIEAVDSRLYYYTEYFSHFNDHQPNLTGQQTVSLKVVKLGRGRFSNKGPNGEQALIRLKELKMRPANTNELTAFLLFLRALDRPYLDLEIDFPITALIPSNGFSIPSTGGYFVPQIYIRGVPDLRIHYSKDSWLSIGTFIAVEL